MKTRSALRAIAYHSLLLLPNLLLILCILLTYLLVHRVWIACTVFALMAAAYHVFLYRRYKQLLFNLILLRPSRAGLAEEYRLALRYAGYDARSSYWLSVSYDVGDYQSVVDICTYYLRHPRRRQPPKYFYLKFLADVYKNLGDRDKLAKVCDAYDEMLAGESFPEKFRYFAPAFEAYRTYLNTEEQAEPNPAEQPLEVTEELLPQEHYKPKRTLFGLATIANSVLLYLIVLGLVVTSAPSLLQAQYYRRMARICEPAVKQTHFDAEYLTYLPIYTEHEYLADLCLYELNGEVWIGELYVRGNHSDVPLISPATSVSISRLEDGSSSPVYLSFPGFVNDIEIYCVIYKSQSQIPEEFNVYEEFEVNGHTYYFVITQILV